MQTIVVGVGSSGTITGLTHFFKKVSAKTDMILADPEGSMLADFVNTGKINSVVGSWLVEGIGEDFIPPISDFSMTKKAYTISDRESFDTVRSLLINEGILAGSSSGTLVCAALKYCREQTTPKRVVSFICDSGNKYLSKMYNDYWLLDQGLYKRNIYGDLRDIISRRFEDSATIFVSPGDTLNTVYSRMKLYDISQVPVIDGNNVVGIVDESDLLLALYANHHKMDNKINEIMTKDLIKIRSSEPIDSLVSVLNAGMTAIVEDENGSFQGLITKIDIINYLRNGK